MPTVGSIAVIDECEVRPTVAVGVAAAAVKVAVLQARFVFVFSRVFIDDPMYKQV